MPTIITHATLITGHDERGNEMGFFQSQGEWYNLVTEMKVTKRFIANFIIPLVVKVRFGNDEYTRMQWIASGCPFELVRDEETESVNLDLTKTAAWMRDAEAEGQEFRDVKFGSKQWFDNIKEVEL